MTSSGKIYMINAVTGAATADGTFAFTGGTVNPNLVSAAYTNSFDNSATGALTAGTTTALYSLDADTDQLIQHATNAASTFNGLSVVGALGANVSAGMTGASGAYLSSAMNGSTTPYTVNLVTGAATNKGTLSGTALTSLALKLAPQ